ncbi:hypothetical protein BH18ACT15_BH18ACT15_03750 [soil metagenome]
MADCHIAASIGALCAAAIIGGLVGSGRVKLWGTGTLVLVALVVLAFAGVCSSGFFWLLVVGASLMGLGIGFLKQER